MWKTPKILGTLKESSEYITRERVILSRAWQISRQCFLLSTVILQTKVIGCPDIFGLWCNNRVNMILFTGGSDWKLVQVGKKFG